MYVLFWKKIIEKVINLTEKERYLPKFFVVLEGMQKKDQVTRREKLFKVIVRKKKFNPSKQQQTYTAKLYIIITLVENFTISYTQSPVHEILTPLSRINTPVFAWLHFIDKIFNINLFLPYIHIKPGDTLAVFISISETLYINLLRNTNFTISNKQIWRQHNPFPTMRFHIIVSNFWVDIYISKDTKKNLKSNKYIQWPCFQNTIWSNINVEATQLLVSANSL